MRKLTLVLVLCMPLMVMAGDGNPVKLNFTEGLKKTLFIQPKRLRIMKKE